MQRNAPLRRKAAKRTPKSKLAKRRDNGRSSYWKKRADAAWREIIRRLFDGRCAVCGVAGGEAHHLISRAVCHTRHSPHNGILLCPLHHKWDRHCSAHGGPLGFAAWLLTYRPAQWAWVQANKHAAVTPEPYRETCEGLQALLDQYQTAEALAEALK